MISIKLNNQINYYLTSLLAFFIPIHSKIPPVLIALLVLNWLIKPSNIKLTVNRIRNNYALLSLVLLFLLYAVGVLLSDNVNFGLKVLETNLSLILLPLIFLAYQNNTKDNIEAYLKFFVIGCLVYILMCFGYAGYACFKPVYTDLYGVMYDLGFNYFFYSYLTLFFHPSYAAMHCVFALLIICLGVINKRIGFNYKTIVAIALLVIFVLLLSSKSGWIGLVFLMLYIFYYLVLKKQLLKIIYIIIPIALAFILLNVVYTPSFSKRIPKVENIKNAITEKNSENVTVTTGGDGNAARVLIWKASLGLFLDNLIGLGTGDAKDILLEKYKEKGMTTEYKYQLNCHNQYLSTALSIGVLGLITLLFALIYPFIQSVRANHIVLAGFIVLISFNFLFESMLETQKGIAFFSFFYVLLCTSFNTKKII